MNIVHEHFKNLHELMTTLEKRPNNSIMEHKYASIEESASFTGTQSYKEAEQLMAHGYTKILPEIKKGMVHANASTSPMQRRRVTTGVQGYAPHVPNAIQGLPNSMISTESQMQKVKAVSIVYAMAGMANVPSSEFIKCGIVVLSIVNKLELSGCRVSLQVAFKHSIVNDEIAIATVNVKSYAEHLDLQKLSFPIAHTSMFRRFGFKWLETSPDITDRGHASGYGRTIHSDSKQLRNAIASNGEILIDSLIIQKNKYDADAIIKSLELN